jgi:hypothetical protein
MTFPTRTASRSVLTNWHWKGETVMKGRSGDFPIVCVGGSAGGLNAYTEHAQEMAAHESPRTTKLYDRTKERLTQEEVDMRGGRRGGDRQHTRFTYRSIGRCGFQNG